MPCASPFSTSYQACPSPVTHPYRKLTIQSMGDIVIAAYVLDLYWLIQEQVASANSISDLSERSERPMRQPPPPDCQNRPKAFIQSALRAWTHGGALRSAGRL